MSPAAPVATIGLHSSASTWVFNVARELLVASYGEDAVQSCYTDDPPDQIADHLLIKSHHGSAALDHWLTTRQSSVILSIRDPRDACLSMAKRFNATLDLTAKWLANDCQRLLRLANHDHPLLRYEDRFFEQPETVARIARHLGLAPPSSTLETIFERYRTETVRGFTQTMASLPPKRLANVGASIMDKVTQLHATHIGDTSSGKWRSLSEARQAEFAKIFAAFLQRFGYEVEAAGPV